VLNTHSFGSKRISESSWKSSSRYFSSSAMKKLSCLSASWPATGDV